MYLHTSLSPGFRFRHDAEEKVLPPTWTSRFWPSFGSAAPVRNGLREFNARQAADGLLSWHCHRYEMKSVSFSRSSADTYFLSALWNKHKSLVSFLHPEEFPSVTSPHAGQPSLLSSRIAFVWILDSRFCNTENTPHWMSRDCLPVTALLQNHTSLRDIDASRSSSRRPPLFSSLP
ncbi:hypothetical protein N431DRAFT_472944 [Stipitochalara longipes BDJ]|nr:hypothetical protein N431DRAFT_472944 [Stipitochalara longipes BDJ]